MVIPHSYGKHCAYKSPGAAVDNATALTCNDRLDCWNVNNDALLMSGYLCHPCLPNMCGDDLCINIPYEGYRCAALSANDLIEKAAMESTQIEEHGFVDIGLSEYDSDMDIAVRQAISFALEIVYNVTPPQVTVLRVESAPGRRLSTGVRLTVHFAVSTAEPREVESWQMAGAIAEEWSIVSVEHRIKSVMVVVSVTSAPLEHADGAGCQITEQSALCALAVKDVEVALASYPGPQFECLPRLDGAALVSYGEAVLQSCPSATACAEPRWTEARCQSEVYLRMARANSNAGYLLAALRHDTSNLDAWMMFGKCTMDSRAASVSLSALCCAAGPDDERTQTLLRHIDQRWEAQNCSQQELEQECDLAELLVELDPPQQPFHVSDDESYLIWYVVGGTALVLSSCLCARRSTHKGHLKRAVSPLGEAANVKQNGMSGSDLSGWTSESELKTNVESL
jgi:hypothetical protein